MKAVIFIIIQLFFTIHYSVGQINKKYIIIDSLINSNSISDAMDALDLLKENYINDTIDAEYWLRFSKASYNFNNDKNAKISIDKAIKINPNNEKYFFEKGMLHNKIGELPAALIALEQAITIKPTGEYFYWKGIVHQQLKNTDSAIVDYKNAINKKFENHQLYNNYAIALSEKGDNSNALININKSLALEKNFSSATSAKAKIYFYLLQIDSACYYGKLALKQGNTNTFIIPESICDGTYEQKNRFNADLLASNKMYKEAIMAYNKLIDSNINSLDDFLNRGYCYFSLHELDKAEKDYLKAIEFPTNSEDKVLDNLSLLYYDQNKFQQSIDYSTKRINLNPSNPVPYIDRGLCFRKLKKYKEAELDFNKALQLKPDFFRAFGYRAFLYLELGLFEKAQADANKSIEIEPEYGYGYLVLADIKRETGQKDFCIDYYYAKKYGELSGAEGIKLYCNNK